MSDLIERDKVIEYCLKLIDVERKQGSDVMNYGQERINQTDTIIAFVENLPSADTPTTMTGVIDAIREAEYRGYMKAVEDRPKGEWKEREMFHNADDNPIIEEWQSARCSVCKKYHTTPYMYYFDSFNFCPNCGADMRGERADEHGRNKSADRQ